MTGAMARARAEAFAAEVLGWLAAEPDRLGPFLASSGAAPADLPAAMRDPEFLGFVLDHLLADEALLLDCCAAIGHPPETPGRARAALPGGDLPHWT